jgi:hypothetical protein
VVPADVWRDLPDAIRLDSVGYSSAMATRGPGAPCQVVVEDVQPYRFTFCLFVDVD